MKKVSKKPGFESIFYLGILLLMVLPAMVFAQQGLTRSLTIVIKNRDTIINGKNINTLSPKDKKEALKAFHDLATDAPPYMSSQIYNHIKHRMPADSMQQFHFRTDTGRRFMLHGRFNNKVINTERDSLMAYHLDTDSNNRITTRIERYHTYGPKDHMPTMHPNMNNYRMPYFGERGYGFMREPGRKDRDTRERQDFDYHTTDKNGFSTNLSFHINVAPDEKVRRLAGAEKADLDIYDLVLTPEFTTGKTTLMFSLPTDMAATIALMDSDGKALWQAKSTGNKFNKTFTLAINGIYFLVVKQGSKVCVKKVIKE